MEDKGKLILENKRKKNKIFNIKKSLNIKDILREPKKKEKLNELFKYYKY